MNSRQAAKAAAKRIKELEWFNRKSAATVKGLYQALDAVFSGEGICQRCEDYDECEKEAKEEGKWCEDWTLKDPGPDDVWEPYKWTIQNLDGGSDES